MHFSHDVQLDFILWKNPERKILAWTVPNVGSNSFITVTLFKDSNHSTILNDSFWSLKNSFVIMQDILLERTKF